MVHDVNHTYIVFRSSVTTWQSHLCFAWLIDHTNSEDTGIRLAANKFVKDNSSTSLQLVFLLYLCLLLLLHLITVYLDSPINSPNGIPGDVDSVKMDERHMPWHSYGRWWSPAINNLRVIWVSRFYYVQDRRKRVGNIRKRQSAFRRS